MNAKSPRAKQFIGTAVAVVVLYGANYVFTPEIVGVTKLESFFRPKGDLQFDHDKWRQKQAASWGERYKMVDDLLRNQPLSGRSQQEVEDLLGKPDIAAPRDNREIELHYTLASQKDFPARSVLFPGRMGNSELWILLLYFRDGRLYSASVVPS